MNDTGIDILSIQKAIKVYVRAFSVLDTVSNSTPDIDTEEDALPDIGSTKTFENVIHILIEVRIV